MTLSKNKTTTTTIALFLVLTIAVTIIALPTATATDPPRTFTTVAFLSASPNPVGVNQQALFVMWIDKAHPTAQGYYGGRFSGCTIEITKPDNSSETIGPFSLDPISSAYKNYSPQQVGIYAVVFHFPAQVIENTNPPPTWETFNHPDQVNDTYAASTSNTVYLNVTEEQVQAWPETSLPTDYWTRPINAMNRNWAQIAGDWLNGAHTADNFNPYSQGPETPHILWARQLWEGGIAGDNAGTSSYLSTTASSGQGSPIIINGRLYISDRASVGRNWGWYCVDLYTGETLYYKNGTNPDYPSFGQVRGYYGQSVSGSWAYLWSTSGSTWSAIDPFTGNTVFTIANVSSAGTAVYGKDSSILRYNIVGSGANKRLTVWNTSKALEPLPWVRGDPQRPYQYSGTYDGRTGFSLNVSIPNVQGSIFAVVEDEYVIGGVSGKQNATHTEPGHLWALSLSRVQEGTLLWNVTFTPPKAVMDVTEEYYYGPYIGTTPGVASMKGPLVYPKEDVFIFWEGATRQFWGYSLKTGDMIWGPTEPQDVWMMFGMNPTVVYGILYTSRYSDQSPGGEIHAYNITTGETLWKYLPGTVNFETPYTNVPTAISAIAGGKIYTISQEHSPTMPLRRDATITCLDAFTGKVLWKISQYMRSQLAISSGYLVSSNLFDDKWYVFGKGPSATTVTTPDIVQPLGTPILIKGTVTDQSPGAKDTPAIADEDQQAWMEYLYMQRPVPTDARGVEVSLDTIDPNGNFVHIDNATSDAAGKFSYLFKPDVPGKYTIIATFYGSKSYGSSSAETAIGVTEAPETPETPGSPQDMTGTYVAYAAVAIIVAIAVVGAILALLIRKRP